MEYVEGEPLKGPLPVDDALTMAGQILDALEAAHGKGSHIAISSRPTSWWANRASRFSTSAWQGRAPEIEHTGDGRRPCPDRRRHDRRHLAVYVAGAN